MFGMLMLATTVEPVEQGIGWPAAFALVGIAFAVAWATRD